MTTSPAVEPPAARRTVGFFTTATDASHGVVRLVARRLALGVPLVFLVSVLTFVLVSLEPGDVVRNTLGDQAPKAAVESLRKQLGLGLPLYTQYWHWLRAAVHGNLGSSALNEEHVSTILQNRFPVTLSLVLCSLVVIACTGVALGVFSAVRGGRVARVVDALSLIGFSIPAFWLGAVLISIFAVKVKLFPAVGYVPLGTSASQWARSLVLPVAALSLHGAAGIARQTREAMADVLGSEHIRMAWASGLPRRKIVFVLALRVTGIRVVTLLGLQVVGLLSGTVFAEQVFALPGLGTTLVQSASLGDLPVVQGVVVFFAVIVVVVNLAVDLAYALLDPRVRIG